MNDPLAIPHLTENDAIRLIENGQSETVEIRGRMTSAKVLADLIAGFAHSQGGYIFFGYHRRKKKVVGCNPDRLRSRHQESFKKWVSCDDFTSIHFFQVHGRHLCVIAVPKLDRLIASASGLVRREGTSLRVLRKEQILVILQGCKTPLTLNEVAGVLRDIARVANDTKDTVKKESSWWTKAKEQVLGFAVGTLLTAGVAYLVSKFR